MSSLAFTRYPVSDTAGFVENLVSFLVQVSDPEAGAISVGFPTPEMFVNIDEAANGTERFGKLFEDRQRLDLQQLNQKAYTRYIIRQALCKNAAWDVFLRQTLAFQSEQIVLQPGDILFSTFTDFPWWFALALYSQACLAANTELPPEESKETKVQPVRRIFWRRSRSSNSASAMEKKDPVPPPKSDPHLERFADYVFAQLPDLLDGKEAKASLADLIMVHQLCLAWSKRISDLRQRVRSLQEKQGVQKTPEERRIEQSMPAQINVLQEVQARLVASSPLTYFSTWSETGGLSSTNIQPQRQLLEKIVKQNQARGLQRWTAGQLVEPCRTDLQALQHISVFFKAICDWIAKNLRDEYLAYQWRLFLLYCYELFAVDFHLHERSYLHSLPSNCVGLADAFVNLSEAFDDASQDPDPNAAKRLFLKEYRWYQEQEACTGLAQALYDRQTEIYNIK